MGRTRRAPLVAQKNPALPKRPPFNLSRHVGGSSPISRRNSWSQSARQNAPQKKLANPHPPLPLNNSHLSENQNRLSVRNKCIARVVRRRVFDLYRKRLTMHLKRCGENSQWHPLRIYRKRLTMRRSCSSEESYPVGLKNGTPPKKPAYRQLLTMRRS